MPSDLPAQIVFVFLLAFPVILGYCEFKKTKKQELYRNIEKKIEERKRKEMLVFVNPTKIKKESFFWGDKKEETLHITLAKCDYLKVDNLENTPIFLWYKNKGCNQLNFAKGYLFKENNGLTFNSLAGFRVRELEELDVYKEHQNFFDENEGKDVVILKIDIE